MTAADVEARPALANALKPAESWWVVLVVDPIAVRVLPVMLRRRWLTANRVTAVAFLVGLVAIWRFAVGDWRGGAVLFEVRFILDCLDGKLARCRGTASAFGAAFDRVADFVTIPCAYAALGWKLAGDGSWDPRLALVVACACAITFVTELALESVRRGHRPTSTFSPSVELGRGPVGWMRRHRLTLRPWTVEAEAVGLFLAPMVLTGHLLARAECVVAVVYCLFIVVDVCMIAADAAAVDRKRGLT